MRLLYFLSFLFCFSISYCQTRKNITTRYTNNNIAARGKVVACSDYNEKYPCYLSTCRKIGKWTYYYQDGNIKKTENYRKIKNCSGNEIPDGIWQYFNEMGTLIRQEVYKNGRLWTADLAKYYYNNELAGEILIRNGVADTFKYMERDNLNLVRNGDFNFYYGPPHLQINEGQNQIENQIPFWISPDSNTPDYYNQFRRLKNVPDNQGHEYNEIYSYVGIILYHEPTGHYSEYITGELNSKLTPNNRYCLKIRIRLSQNSGFYINKFGVYLSDSVSSGPDMTMNSMGFPPVLFNETLDNRDEWKTLCALFAASGREKHITLGRFSSLSETTIRNSGLLNPSEGDYNKSAYYIIDRIEVLKDTTGCLCYSRKSDYGLIDRINFDQVNPADSLILKNNKTFVLKNIFFDFDKTELLPDSYNELEKLLAFLQLNNVSIILSGHTDNVGTKEYNKALSLSRARAVADWLVQKGTDQNRIQIEGYGAEIPVAENNSEENRNLNRRVEFKIK